jgi:hypothetical protein
MDGTAPTTFLNETPDIGADFELQGGRDPVQRHEAIGIWFCPCW